MKTSWRIVRFALVCATTFALWIDVADAELPPDHSPQWNGTLIDLNYNLELPFIGTEYPDRVAHEDPAYPYGYCQRGVKLDTVDLTFVLIASPLEFDYSYLSGGTILDRKSNMFVMKGNGFPAVCIAGLDANDWPKSKFRPKYLVPSLANGGYGTLKMKGKYKKWPYNLYRYLNFRNSFELFSGGSATQWAQPDGDIRKIFVLIHGWNPPSEIPPTIPSGNMYSSEKWDNLISNLTEELTATDWGVVLYHWEDDADTGRVLSASKAKVDIPGTVNGTEAAEIALLHGQHLGELIPYLAPNLEKVQFIAHSAGAWAAYISARELLESTTAEVQVTLLDPFMPYEGKEDSVGSCLGKKVIDGLDSVVGNNRLVRLENYFSTLLDPTGSGTKNKFAWNRPGDIRGINVSWKGATAHYAGHSGPIQFYADSIIDQVLSSTGTGPSNFGWRMSMAYDELSSTGPTAEFSAIPTSGLAPLIVQFTDESTPGTSPITSWAWDFNNDGTVDSTEQNPQPIFQDPGIYDVKVTVDSASGSDDKTKLGLIAVGTLMHPSVALFQINEGAATSTSHRVTLNTECTGTPTHYMASEFEDFTSALWETYDVAPNFDLSAGYGSKTVYLKVKNDGGESAVVSGSISIVELNPGDTQTIMLPGNVPLVMVWIPAGSFMMGAYGNEEDSHPEETPQHAVTLSGFWLGRYEVTKAQWKAVMNTEPWLGGREDRLIMDPNSPAEYISWMDIQEFLIAINSHIVLTGQGAESFHLPSEAQWEYACRAGTTSRFYWGEDGDLTLIDDFAWYDKTALFAGELYAHVVGLKNPNGFGLYDMSGNVNEFCADTWHENYIGAPTDGSAWTENPNIYNHKVLRSTGWQGFPYSCRSAWRTEYTPFWGWYGIGFRAALSHATKVNGP